MTDLSLSNIDFPDEDVCVEERGKYVNDGFGRFGVNELVGHGSVTNANCGTYRGRYGCLNVDGHRLPLQLQGKKFENQIYQHPVFYSCHKPSCPKCFRSWMSREGKMAEARLLEAEKFFGKPEHIIASVPIERYGLSFESIRALTVKALRVRGVVGGCLIFHGFRYNRREFWYWSPHFHVLGFIEGGYRCRSCVRKFCSGCHGFEAHTRECFKRDGFIVKVAVDDEGRGVARERWSVFATIKYQLSHSSIRTDVKRPHVLTWFGVCSYRQLKFKYVLKKAVCPLCSGKLVKIRYFGSKRFCIDRDSPDFVFESVEDLFEDRVEVWQEVVSVGYSG